MTDQKKRPTGIHIENCEDVTLTGNVGIGDMDFIVAKNSKNISGSGNLHIGPDEIGKSPTPKQPEKPKQSFWFHPITKTILYVVGVVAAAAIVFFLGFKN